jgi:two-component system sensor histidine kinase KdpD
MPEERPEPDEVLDRFKRSQAASVPVAADGRSRGQLKIFFGMSPGVGKTYAMLAAAQRMATQGVDVVVGVVETHGRAETEQMLLGLDIIPPRAIAYQGKTLHEFDADAAIARRPDILLIDELAHANAPGSLREKRWQDVQECLRAGVNVYTTLNVQHLESLNDVIWQITGVRVNETIPDRVFDEADEVELVDLPPEALHERLRAGKVYLGEHAARAVDSSDGFFRKGNLTALRELALRRTAAWVDSELRRYRQDRGIRAVWPAGERIVVAVSPSPMSGKLVRAAKRMAAGLHADLIAVYVETPRTAALSTADRDRLNANLRLAESLGATSATLAGDNAAGELVRFARSRNVGRIIVGKTERPRWKEVVFGSFIDNLIRESGDIEISVVRGDEGPLAPAVATQYAEGAEAHAPRARILADAVATVATIAVSTALSALVYRPPDLSEESLLLLGGVVIAALWRGRLAAALASVLAVLSCNFFFTEPRFTLNVNDPGYLLTLAVMFAVGVIVGSLAARAREQTLRARTRERTTAAQFSLSRELGAARTSAEVAAIAARHTHDLLQADVVICSPSGAARPGLDLLASAGVPDWFQDIEGRERGVGQWALDHARPAGMGTQKLPASAGRYIPLIGTSGKVGLMGVRPSPGAVLSPTAIQTLDAIAAQTASAMERVALSESQQAAKLEAERERLRSALLSSVSHDLRTPLASITGAASTLEQSADDGLERSTRAALLRTIIDESSRLNDIIANLVFATRLESGAVSPRREWTTVEEVVGVGLARHREALAARNFRVHIPPDLPMIRVDNAMLPQVIHNLVENALRYSPAGVPTGVSAWTTESNIIVKVWDEGPGLAEDEASKVFERFYRGRASRLPTASAPAASTGMGLGLTICEGIVRAHGGRIWAEPNAPRGVAFLFSIPVEYPQPAMPAELAPGRIAEQNLDRGER